jgi:hypothetical protein
MFKKARLLLWGGIIAVGLTLIGAGAALSAPCDGNPCDLDTSNCINLDESVSDLCCVDPSWSGNNRCHTCTRDYFECYDQTPPTVELGPAYGCVNPTQSCTQ